MQENNEMRQRTEDNQALTNVDKIQGESKDQKDKTKSEKLRYEHADEIYE